ncbi:MAG: hypothetical protein ACRYGR_01760 [Janthinobacterium lividum]
MATIIKNQRSRTLEVLSKINVSLEEYLGIDDNQRLATPRYMIRMDSLLSSQVENFNDAIQLYEYDLDMSRTTDSNIGDTKQASGRVEFSNPVIFISNVTFTPTLTQRLIDGIIIEKIEFIRLQNIEKKNQPAETITFKNCYFQAIALRKTILVGDFRFSEYSHWLSSISQDGKNNGNLAASYNLVTGNSDVSSGGDGEEA